MSFSPAISFANMDTSIELDEEQKECCKDCACPKQNEKSKSNLSPEEVEILLKKRENELTAAFQEQLKRETDLLKQRADFILQNEQIRSTYMLREAHRERKEKVSALQTQLECKNLAGLMYVMCSERRKSKLEKLRIIEEYTNYIRVLQDILTEAQALILNLSRGFKTAERVEKEWREKMMQILTEFIMFVHDFSKGTPESDQFFFDLPKLLETKTSLVDNPDEDPCNENKELPEVQEEAPEQKVWYERLDEECRPFIMFGDMAEMKPDLRREVLRAQKEAVVVANKWKEYVFRDMYLNAECPNTDSIKDEYPKRVPTPERWQCHLQPIETRNQSQVSFNSRRTTTASVDMRGNMGSILKLITSSAAPPQPKSTLLGARDSMEIASTTKLRSKHKHLDSAKVVINIGKRRASLFGDGKGSDDDDDDEKTDTKASSSRIKDYNLDEDDESESIVGSRHILSCSKIPDHKIAIEKVCPMKECRRMKVDSFTRSLPAYMRASPFAHFEQTFENYETCTSEQLEILKHRIEGKKKKERKVSHLPEDPLREWSASVDGVAVQTSDMSPQFSASCMCRAPNTSPAESTGNIVLDMKDLIPVKQMLDRIHRQCFFDSTIEFDRFKVIGQESITSTKEQSHPGMKKNRLQEVTKVLKQHPSLLDIFQANTM